MSALKQLGLLLIAATFPLIFVCLQQLQLNKKANYLSIAHSTNLLDLPLNAPETSTENKTSTPRNTKIVAITDINYAHIAQDWHNRLISLGYPSHQAIVVAADDATMSFFENTNVTVEPMLHPNSEGWPVADPAMKGQIRRRRIFSTRWVYALHQLRNGYSVLLTDADNIFVRYLDTVEFEKSGYDVIHAYCHNFPVRFLSMGFTVCGGMVWLKGNENGVEEDGPAVRYVKSVLEQCRWSGIENGELQLQSDGAHNKSQAKNDSDLSKINPSPLKAPPAQCDDQQVVNSKFFSNTLNYTWDIRPNDGFWKHEASGKSLVTGHRFKIWDVDTAYRGNVNGYKEENVTANSLNRTEQLCPTLSKSWVAMPHNTITEKQILDPAKDRILRMKQWYQFCRNETDPHA